MYWERLHLVRPQARWGERFYRFDDLVALQSIKQLAANRIPVARLRRAILTLQRQYGALHAPLAALHVSSRGRQVVVVPPAPRSQPFEPLTGQFVLPLNAQTAQEKMRAVAARTAEEWFAMGMAADSCRETLSQAVDAYRHATELAPGWVDAQINLGAALYQLSELAEARRAFETALALEPENPTAHFNLGCVLDDLEEYDLAIRHFRRAVAVSPQHADAHFNLALLLEKRGKRGKAREHWTSYLRLQPRGPWAEYARTRLRLAQHAGRAPSPIPFPSASQHSTATRLQRDNSSRCE